MTVHQLITFLQEQDDNAEVVVKNDGHPDLFEIIGLDGENDSHVNLEIHYAGTGVWNG